jgi:hypothetical protein
MLYHTELNKTLGVLASRASVKKYGLAEVEGNPALFPDSLESEQNRLSRQAGSAELQR